MSKLFNIFKETFQHMTIDEIALQLYLININRKYPVPGDTVDVINEFEFPFLKRVLLYSIEWFRFGTYAKLSYEDQLYKIPIERVVIADQEGTNLQIEEAIRDFIETVKELPRDVLIYRLFLVTTTFNNLRIPWQRYDPSNPPANGEYLVSNGKEVDAAIMNRIYDLTWSIRDNSPIDGAVSVTHFAVINLPEGE
ncbi:MULTISPECIES: hypothetical protein [unclassified Paenibacillus]|uniref:hypothetical protein n=1 Tax=unclassified Paenibacillus TaxID=185978 RepID=UPI0009A75418|nr:MULTISPECIES: hypothetical protein [unclassified Paenibacillus]SLK16782.1 hypothetical protein SAMN06272722_110248 [Paenibacillus sp. RU5A]SOC74470.1 hypothetical protein SAMN05880581_110248 [Paenibacillus sp. RU26A]SOC76658.1 hypothetical protein SAMN05880586_110248 [Paenibacillus sp. RU5M]